MSEALTRVTRLVPWRASAIRNWPIWTLPRWLTVYVLAVIAADLAAIAVTARHTAFSSTTWPCSACCLAARRSPSN